MKIWQTVANQFELSSRSIHGPKHWRTVQANGLYIAQTNEADEAVVKLFAVFHDSRRESDGHDPQHGQRGAELAIAMHGHLFEIEPHQLELLVVACELHHQGAMSDDATIGTCFDADRLDLVRVNVMPKPELMCTAEGKLLAGKAELPRRR